MLEQTVLIMLGFSICLIILDIWQGFGHASGIKCVGALYVPQYSYNNIIVVANVILLQFLSSRFVYPGAPQLTILYFLTRVRA